MPVSTIAHPTEKSDKLDLNSVNRVRFQLSPTELVQDTLRLGKGALNQTGALLINTGEFTGRSPKDKFIVKDAITAETVDWNEFNLPLQPTHFDIIYKIFCDYLNRQPELWVRDCYACADPNYRLNIRVVNEEPADNLFAYNMFLRPDASELGSFQPDWQVWSAPGLRLDPEQCGTRRPNAAVISFRHKIILIAGTGYTGEIKKGIFTVLNYLLPRQQGVLSMHCSANMGPEGDTALFFGLSGTGKTTLSADPSRRLIGDDEHGWADNGVFNFEGGCYAKTIDLSAEKEPEIYHAIRKGALVENVVCFPNTNEIDFSSRLITENTRVSYPLDYIRNAQIPSLGNIPSNIFFLTCDASGVLPPVSRLNAAQAMYQFISGYTAKVAGTEAGVTEPAATFSACFGAPFMPLHPGRYSAMLGEKIRLHQVKIWLVNTGWTGGSYGSGSRIRLPYTRAMITAALTGELDLVEFHKDPLFGFDIPVTCPGVPSGMLDPRNTWPDKEAYDRKARELANKFVSNFKKFEVGVNKEILAAAPKSSPGGAV